LYARYTTEHADLADALGRMHRRELPDGWDADIPTFPADAKGLATRDSSGKVLNAIARHVPWLLGGSADLAPSTKTRLTFDGAGDFSATNRAGRNFHFGVREHAMGSALNGLALSRVRGYGSGFLIFSDYSRPTLRLSSIMEQPVIYIYTHDSIGVGEDGPTHQPIEHLASLRAIPGMVVLRPADANEVVEAWRVIMGLKHEPVALVLTRQAVPTVDRGRYAAAAGLHRGAYVLADARGGAPQVMLLASGSEVSLCVEAYERLAAEGIRARVVSMPSWELFEQQDRTYREAVLPAAITARVSVEQGSTLGWHRYVGSEGTTIGMKTFGASAPLKSLLQKFGFTADAVVAAAKAVVR
jgi:transketolase